MSHDPEDEGGDAPCFAHHLVGGHPVDPETARDVARFRKGERARLLEARKLSTPDRDAALAGLRVGLEKRIRITKGVRIAAYWPIRSEPDLRGWMKAVHSAGAQILLPVVAGKSAPLEFHHWSPGCRMTRGVWNIPVPADGAPDRPDIVISPLLGVDHAFYRLGNGGGYYDRTLAALDPRPHVIGVGLAGCMLPTIYPMPWDIPMDEIILSDGTMRQRAGDRA
ncbi:MAG TPA: 5-formyltetrahydrofolate cyclo-ligase [Roseovarius sp.]|nr:5-formyltetrahydrofolate cyclo-ligase [Roseovarius sp.]